MALECVVSPDTAPYLVTSSKGLAWVGKCTADHTINVAVRLKTSPDQFFLDVVEAVYEAGRKLDWGNVHALTAEGVKAAIGHLEEYDLGGVEILIPAQDPTKAIANLVRPFEFPMRPCSWLPKDLVVVVPKDRGFVGAVYRVSGGDIVGLVHNAARGIAIVSNRSPSNDVVG